MGMIKTYAAVRVASGGSLKANQKREYATEERAAATGVSRAQAQRDMEFEKKVSGLKGLAHLVAFGTWFYIWSTALKLVYGENVPSTAENIVVIVVIATYYIGYRRIKSLWKYKILPRLDTPSAPREKKPRNSRAKLYWYALIGEREHLPSSE